jgi:hypothetical protein
MHEALSNPLTHFCVCAASNRLHWASFFQKSFQKVKKDSRAVVNSEKPTRGKLQSYDEADARFYGQEE